MFFKKTYSLGLKFVVLAFMYVTKEIKIVR